MGTLYYLKVEPNHGIKKEYFQIQNIEKLDVIKYPQNEELALLDSSGIQQILAQVLNSREIKVTNYRSGHSAYHLIFHYTNSKVKNCHLITDSWDGDRFSFQVKDYKNDSLFILLDTLMIE